MTSYMLAVWQVRLLILLGKLASFRSAISLTERHRFKKRRKLKNIAQSLAFSAFRW
jgi:hypothetical protein